VEAFNPDTSVHLQKVDDELLYAPSTLAGATRRPRIEQPPQRTTSARWKVFLIGAGLLVSLIYVWSQMSDSAQPEAPAGGTVSEEIEIG